jgi:hypothetical protein
VLFDQDSTMKTNPVGCYFRLSNEPEVGSPMTIEIHIPPELTGQVAGTLLCQGKVVQVKKTDPGSDGHTGVTCSIDEYELVPEAADYTPRKTSKR